MAQAPFDALRGLADKCRESAAGLPQKIEAVPRWRGLGFMALGVNFVAPMGQIVEMMEMPVFTRLPGVQPWVVGLSNVRGRLLPLFDFPMFLGGQLGQQKRHHRILLLETEDLFSGLIVERAMGMQHFQLDQFNEGDNGGLAKSLQPYVSGSFVDASSQKWHVLDFFRLAADPRFANASLV